MQIGSLIRLMAGSPVLVGITLPCFAGTGWPLSPAFFGALASLVISPFAVPLIYSIVHSRRHAAPAQAVATADERHG